MDVLRAIEQTDFSVWVRESGSIWSYPTIIFFHSVGLAVIVGLSAALDLRVLGFGAGIPLAPLKQLFPIMWAGFWVNALSGLMLTVADASTMLTSWLFLLEKAVIGLSLVTMVWLKLIGMALLIGVVGLFDLRMLGGVKGLPLRPLQRLLTWGVAGFIINLATGIAFYAGDPFQYIDNKIFWLKVAFIALGVRPSNA